MQQLLPWLVILVGIGTLAYIGLVVRTTPVEAQCGRSNRAPEAPTDCRVKGDKFSTAQFVQIGITLLILASALSSFSPRVRRGRAEVGIWRYRNHSWLLAQKVVCAGGYVRSRLQRSVEEGQASLHAVVDARMVVVDFLVSMGDAVLRSALRQNARAVVDMKLVSPSTIDVDAFEALQARPVLGYQVDRIMLQPLLPAHL